MPCSCADLSLFCSLSSQTIYPMSDVNMIPSPSMMYVCIGITYPRIKKRGNTDVSPGLLVTIQLTKIALYVI